jgi:hypothetical protein
MSPPVHPYSSKVPLYVMYAIHDTPILGRKRIENEDMN